MPSCSTASPTGRSIRTTSKDAMPEDAEPEDIMPNRSVAESIDSSRIRLLQVDRVRDDVMQLADALEQMFTRADAPVVMPLGPGEDPRRIADDLTERLVRLPDDVRLVMRTSGSTTGHGRLVGLSAAQLKASIRATDARLGGPARRLLALLPPHIGGLQVGGPAVLDGSEPIVLEQPSSTQPGSADRHGADQNRAQLLGAQLDRAISELRRDDPSARIQLSLVPTQLRDLLASAQGADALCQLTGVLVGGAATDPQLLARAAAAGVTVHLSYGMSETCGGCVYDGRPLNGVQLALGDSPQADDQQGPIWLSGPMVMSGYLDAGDGIQHAGGQRWLRTSDMGRMVTSPAEQPRLEVLGRADNVIVSGGLKITASQVRAAIIATDMVTDAAVLGLDDPRWGQAVTAVVVPTSGSVSGEWTDDSSAHLRDLVGARLGRDHAPRVVVAINSLPLLASGKLDQVATRRGAQRAVELGTAWVREN